MSESLGAGDGDRTRDQRLGTPVTLPLSSPASRSQTIVPAVVIFVARRPAIVFPNTETG